MVIADIFDLVEGAELKGTVSINRGTDVFAIVGTVLDTLQFVDARNIGKPGEIKKDS